MLVTPSAGSHPSTSFGRSCTMIAPCKSGLASRTLFIIFPCPPPTSTNSTPSPDVGALPYENGSDTTFNTILPLKTENAAILNRIIQVPVAAYVAKQRGSCQFSLYTGIVFVSRIRILK
jgi:hypothetical protein